jgi:uncharacterized protein YacL
MPTGTPQPPTAADGKSPMLTLLRIVFLVLLVVLGAFLIIADSSTPTGGLSLVRWWPLALGGVLLFFGGIVAIDVLIPKRKLSTITAIFVGLIAGVVVTAILGLVLDLFGETYDFADERFLEPLKIMLGLGICYLTISTVLQTQDDFRLVIPYVEFAKKIRGARPVVLDTSALIDGRVLDLAQTGVFQSSIIVPRFVIDELQRLSDSSDRLKRARGRRGLEAVTKLQRTAAADVRIEEATSVVGGVDQAVIELARGLPATIVTTDLGLARVAAIEGAHVLNLHDLAQALRPPVVPGEPLALHITRRGEQPGQGVGYLDDGTMVVVEDGQEHIGTQTTVTVTGTMQTSAGRLIFARHSLDDSGPPTSAHEGEASPTDVDADRPARDDDSESPAAAATSDAPTSALPPRVVPPAAPTRPARTPLGPGRVDPNQPRSSRNPRRG